MSFIMSGEIPFRHLYTSFIREFKHRWYGEISKLPIRKILIEHSKYNIRGH